jgi:uncharacterized membrane protein
VAAVPRGARLVTRRRVRHIGLLVSGCLPLLLLLDRPPSLSPLIYSCVVLAWFARQRRGWSAAGGALVDGRWLPPLIVLSGFLAEILAWTDSYLRCEEQPALLHPQLLPDLLLSIGFYGSWAIAWALLTRWFAFGSLGVFATQGAYGVMVEQQGAILVQGLAAMPLGLALWAYVFVFYGSIVTLPYLLVEPVGGADGRRRWFQYPLAFLVLFLLLALIVPLWGAGAEAAGLVPSRRPICDHPFL